MELTVRRWTLLSSLVVGLDRRGREERATEGTVELSIASLRWGTGCSVAAPECRLPGMASPSPFYWSSADQLALPTHAQTWGGKLSGEGREGRRGEEEGRRREREGEGEERVRGGWMLDWCLLSRLRGSAPSSNKR